MLVSTEFHCPPRFLSRYNTRYLAGKPIDIKGINMAEKYVSTSFNDNICIVTMDRPPVNCLNGSLMEEVVTVFTDLADNAALRAVIITGNGKKAFVAGADIAEVKDLVEDGGRMFSRQGQAMTNSIANCPVPVICAINGLALGGGAEIALACDIRIMADNALIGFPEASLGLFPGAGGTQRLPRLVSSGMARLLLLTGAPITADEARACSLVDKVVPAEELMECCLDVAGKIARNGPLAIKAIKRLMIKTADLSMEEGLAMENDEFGRVCATKDKTEGITAFFEKRRPVYLGR